MLRGHTGEPITEAEACRLRDALNATTGKSNEEEKRLRNTLIEAIIPNVVQVALNRARRSGQWREREEAIAAAMCRVVELCQTPPANIVSTCCAVADEAARAALFALKNPEAAARSTYRDQRQNKPLKGEALEAALKYYGCRRGHLRNGSPNRVLSDTTLDELYVAEALERLTERQRVILDSHGTYREIAEQLGLSERTVEREVAEAKRLCRLYQSSGQPENSQVFPPEDVGMVANPAPSKLASNRASQHSTAHASHSTLPAPHFTLRTSHSKLRTPF